MSDRMTENFRDNRGVIRNAFTPIRIFVVIVILLLLAGTYSIYTYLPSTMRSSAIDTALQSNIETIEQIKLMRSYYTQTIVARALKTEALKPTMNYKDHPNEIPIPATMVKDLSELMSKQNTSLSLVSPYPWPHRAERVLDEFESEAWKAFQTDPNAVMSRVQTQDGKRILRVAVADRMVSQACVNCHNADPLSVKRDWKLGDVRAVFEVTKIIEPYLALADEKSGFIATIISILAAIGCLGLVYCVVLVERRTREMRLADEHAYYMAEHDVLTGLSNRARLNVAIDAAFDDSIYATRFSLFLIDLDHFKPVNDTFGHGVGDELLQQVAARLRHFCRGKDKVARLGGDEFAILRFGRLSPEELKVLGRSMCHRLAEPYHLDEHNITIGATIGISQGRIDAENATDLLIAADLALYSAKTDGRGRCALFHSDLMISSLNRRHFEADLREALSRNEFSLHYQPIGAIRSGNVVRYEALLRWNQQERGSVSPVDFIPLAEETGLIIPIGEWVIRTACQEMARMGSSFRVAVNLSPKQLHHDALLEVITSALASCGLEPSRLEIEITESSMMDKSDKTLKVLNDIRSLGVKISLDDFGTGYSCLSYLQNYPVDCVKLDKSFVSQIGKSGNAEDIMKAIIELAHALKLETVAEGVETREQLIELSKLGCDCVQGFLFGRPKPIQDWQPHEREHTGNAF